MSAPVTVTISSGKYGGIAHTPTITSAQVALFKCYIFEMRTCSFCLSHMGETQNPAPREYITQHTVTRRQPALVRTRVPSALMNESLLAILIPSHADISRCFHIWHLHTLPSLSRLVVLMSYEHSSDVAPYIMWPQCSTFPFAFITLICAHFISYYSAVIHCFRVF